MKRLEEEGLALVERIIEEGRPQRKLYRITDSGLEELRLWLEEPVKESQPRNELLLKLFFGKRVDSSVSVGHLQSYVEELEERQSLLETIQGEMDLSLNTRADAKFWMMSLRYGILECQSKIQWAKESIQILIED